jgi:hypothetical protein
MTVMTARASLEYGGVLREYAAYDYCCEVISCGLKSKGLGKVAGVSWSSAVTRPLSSEGLPLLCGTDHVAG